MKSIVTGAALLIIAMFMVACSSVYDTSYSYQSPVSQSGKQCTVQCLQTKNSCQQLCQNDSPACKARARERARLDYNDYVSSQNIAGKPVTRDLNSFYDPLQCASPSCNCEADFRACYQLCGGQVKEEKTCVANCPR